MFATLTLYGDSMLVLYLQLFVLALGDRKKDTKEQSQDQAVFSIEKLYTLQREWKELWVRRCPVPNSFFSGRLAG